MDRGTWQATVHRVTKSRTRLKQLSTHAHDMISFTCNVQNRQICKDLTQISCCLQLAGEGRELGEGVTIDENEVSCGHDENASKLDYCMVAQLYTKID